MRLRHSFGPALLLALLLLSGCSGNSGGGGTAPNIGGAAGETASTSKDTEVTKAVQEKIDTHTELKAAGIQAKAAGGQVELTGTVATSELKDKAEELAFEALEAYKDVNAGVLNSITFTAGSGN
jgi:osmotically-inducible protein OsmY